MGANIPLNHTLLMDWNIDKIHGSYAKMLIPIYMVALSVELPALLESKENIYFIEVTFQQALC